MEGECEPLIGVCVDGGYLVVGSARGSRSAPLADENLGEGTKRSKTTSFGAKFFFKKIRKIWKGFFLV